MLLQCHITAQVGNQAAELVIDRLCEGRQVQERFSVTNSQNLPRFTVEGESTQGSQDVTASAGSAVFRNGSNDQICTARMMHSTQQIKSSGKLQFSIRYAAQSAWVQPNG